MQQVFETAAYYSFISLGNGNWLCVPDEEVRQRKQSGKRREAKGASPVPFLLSYKFTLTYVQPEEMKGIQ